MIFQNLFLTLMPRNLRSKECKGNGKSKKDQRGFAMNGGIERNRSKPFHGKNGINDHDRRGHQENQELTLDSASRGTLVLEIHGMLN